jgi:hypothetical protein
VTAGALNLAANNVAPTASWNALISALKSGPLASRRVVFNLGGERLPNQGQTWTPAAVANFCRSGGVFIDFCGGPMYYAANPTLTGDPGWAGFKQFLQAAGAYGLPYSNFDTSTISSGYGQTYPYLRSLVLTSAPPQVSWFDPNLRAANARPYKTGTVAGNFWVYASFAIMVGSGMYCYAYGGMRSNLGFSYQAGVPASTYAAFINGAAQVMGNGVVPVATSGGGTPTSPGAVAPPTGLHVVSTTTTTATYAWSAVSGASAIHIGRATSSGTTERATLPGTATSVTLTGLAPGSSIAIAVNDTRNGVTSAWSSPVTATTKTATSGGGGSGTGGSTGGGSTGGGGSTPATPGQYTIPVNSTTGLGALSTQEKVALGAGAVALIGGGILILTER